MQGRSDNEILAWIDSVGGTETFLEQAFSGMCDAFRAERAGGRNAVIAWEIRTRDRGVVSYQVVVADGTCHAERDTAFAPGVVLDIDMVDFLRLLMGSLGSVEAVQSGKLNVSGDRVLASAIGDWFQGSN
jgi:putative sterol carrier protein